MIDSLFQSGGIETLEKTMSFAGRRHQLLVHNIANLSTPGFRPLDVNVGAFRESLRDAVERQREAHPALRGPLEPRDTHDVSFRGSTIELDPQPASHNILFHDGNDRDVERTMQDLVENLLTFRQASELLRSRFHSLETAIRERL